MIKFNIQFFAHKKEWVLPRTEETQSQSVLVLKEQTVSLFLREIFLLHKGEQRYIPALMWVVAQMTRFLRWLTVKSNLSAWAKTERKFQFIQ